MAINGQDIGLLFGVLGGGSISGESGKLIREQLDSIVSSLNNDTNSKRRRIKLVSITAPGWTITVELDTTVETDAPAVEPWSWSNSNGSASASQTRAAYSAIQNNGSLDNFSYLVWNDMVDKVKEVLDATGDSWNNRYASYSATKMSSSDKRLTAARFNSLRHNIGTHYSTGITDVYRGDTIYGWYFTTLANCLNSWIG